MNRASANREAWFPQTREDRDEILRELREVLASPHFCNSKRYPSLLKYIVENTLAGRSELLKERTLGVEVFDRPPTYDTNADTVVRYTAGEVRKRLLLYYSEHGKHSSIQISLPAGSYIPEFVHKQDATEGEAGHSGSVGTLTVDDRIFMEQRREAQESAETIPSLLAGGASRFSEGLEADAGALRRRTRIVSKRVLWLALAAVTVIVAIAILRWKFGGTHPQTAVDDFWTPVLRDQHVVSMYTGSVVFAQNNFSGTLTAGRDIDYPFVSMQGASAIAQISTLLQRAGGQSQLESAATAPLTEIREHSIILLGGYNNQWTMRLLQPLRFHFAPEPDAAIVDRMHPEVRWARDRSVPYSSADDYALVARYRDATTDSWVVALAGLGRNGSEAAAEFVSSPHYMQLLRDQMGRDFSSRNIEAVLKVSVIDGKTGAPSIIAVYSW